jgi:urease accessory protein UreF
MSYLQATLPKLVPAWFEDVTATVVVAVPNHEIDVKPLDLASLANATSRLATRLQDISVNTREFTTFTTSTSQASERTRFDSAHNPFTAISRSMWAFLRRMWWRPWLRQARYRIPSEHATGVCMRVLGESWLLDLERVALTHVASAGEEAVPSGTRLPEKGLSEVFAIRYSIAVALAALQ